MQAALLLAFEVGPQSVTTGMIADRLGLTQPAIYKHFSNKDEIWVSAAEFLCDQISENITHTTEQATDPQDQVRRLILGHLQLLQRAPALPEIMVSHGAEDGQSAVQSKIQIAMAGFTDAMTQAIQSAQSAEALRTDLAAKDMAALLLGVIQSLVLRLLVTRNPAVLMKEGERFLDMQLFLLAGREGCR